MRRLTLLLCLLGCDATDASEDALPADAGPLPDAAPEAPADPEPVFLGCNVITELCPLPFPSSVFTKVDDSTPSGLRVDLSGPAIGDLWERLDAVPHDGFSPVGAIVTLLPAAVDPALLPADPEASLAPDAAVWLVEASHDDGERGRRVPFSANVVESEEADQRLLVLEPAETLASERRYAVVVRTALSEPSAVTRALLAEEAPEDAELQDLHTYYADLRALVETLGVEDVGQLWDFQVRSTEGATADLRAMVEFNRAWLEQNPPEVTLAEGREVREGVQRYDFQVELPIWKADRDAMINRGDDGRPTPIRFEPVGATLMVPPGATPDAPLQRVLFGHGLSASMEVMVPVLSEMDLDGAGFAVMVVDWDLHGARGGGINDILHISGELNVLAFAAMMQQSVADGVVYRAVLESIGEVPGRGAVLRDGANLYIGQSLGSMLGTMLAALEPELDALVLNVGGQAVSTILRTGEVVDALGLQDRILAALADNPVDGAATDLTVETLMVTSQLGLDFGEPGLYAPHVLRDRFDDEAPPAVLVQQSVGDGIVPNLTSDALGRALGVPLIEPVLREVTVFERAMAPTGGAPSSGITQFRVSDVGFEAHLAMGHLPVQTQALRYLGSFVDDDEGNDGDIAYDCDGPCDLVE